MIGWALVTIPLFLFLYFRAYWVSANRIAFYISAIFLLGIVQAHINPGASVFLIYAAAFCCRLRSPKIGLMFILAMMLVIALHTYLLNLPLFYLLPALFFVFLIGVSNIYMYEIAKKNKALKLSQEQVKRLAQTAERERIARDLHDLVGHTFSMITMKAQLARKLFDHDVDKAKNEIQDLEAISREALSQIRETVTGYRKKDLSTAILEAQALLSAADIQCRIHFEEKDINSLSEDKSIALAFTLRELVNNVVKHSNATQCSIRLSLGNNKIFIEIKDNGDAGELKPGNGLSGVNERISALAGEVFTKIENGLCVRVSVPQ
uniref:sensor histidine kinase n=1 Tax=Ningiella ruwaisensis TaxID=2364274 RepID=UPI0010A0390A|nr:sensor histidine kinase [Ningiella ruwaisensis]